MNELGPDRSAYRYCHRHNVSRSGGFLSCGPPFHDCALGLLNEATEGYRYRIRELRDLRRLGPDQFLRETFTLPLNAARLKARQILDEYPAGGYMTMVENWASASRRADQIHDATPSDGGLVVPA
jgi:hypothetical protein